MRYAAIDIGSNAIRLLIAETVTKRSQITFKKTVLLRLPIRLGEDVFTNREISKNKKKLLIEGISAFKSIVSIYGVNHLLAYATSAFREANNSKEIAEQVYKETGIRIKKISGEHEAELIHNQEAIKALIDPNKTYLYIDIGGGSTEISLFKKGKIETSRSFKLGTVRILQGKAKKSEWKAMDDYINKTTLKQLISGLIGTGGNVNKYAKIIGNGKKLEKVKQSSFLLLYKQFCSLTYAQRMKDYELNSDRADVIVPAGTIFEKIFKITNAPYLYVPKVGLADGMVREMYNNKA